MAQTSFGWKGTVNELQWAQLAALMGHGSGLARVGDCAVSQVTGQRAVSVAAGGIFGDGVLTTLSAAETMTLPPPTNGQWFLLVLNRVWSTKTTLLDLRPSATTATAAPGAVPSAYPASYKSGIGSNSDVALAWLWGNSGSTAVTIVPILRAPSSIQPRRGTSAQRDALYGTPPSVAGQIYLQGADWVNTETNVTERYSGAYDATLNPRGLDTAGWWSQPTRRSAYFRASYPNTGSSTSNQNLTGLTLDRSQSVNPQFTELTTAGFRLIDPGVYMVSALEDLGAGATSRSWLQIISAGFEVSRAPIPVGESAASTSAVIVVGSTPVEVAARTLKQTGGNSTVSLGLTAAKVA